MTSTAKAEYRITDGYEESYSKNNEGQKLTTGRFTISYHGDLEGEGHLMELKNHLSEDIITVYGLERFTGTICGRSGSLVLEYSGKYINGLLHSNRRIVEDSGTGDLSGIEGEIHFDFNNAKMMSLTLQYAITTVLHKEVDQNA